MSHKYIGICVLLAAVLLASGCKPVLDMRNPASVFCEENGGKLEIRTLEDGGQVGFCLFEDGSECEEWDYYRGDCQPGDSLQASADMPNPASVFCEENGGKLEIRTAEDGSQTGICIFEDDSECDEWTFFRGECKQGDSLVPAAGIPNPASQFCQEQGGKLVIDTDAFGGQVGLCQFDDGSTCEEWAFYRGECQKGGIYVSNEIAADGCQVYRHPSLGYSIHLPIEANMVSSGDPHKTMTIQGPLVNNEFWPVIYINHPSDREAYLPPIGVELSEWLKEYDLLIGTRMDDLTIAGETTLHLRQEASPQSFASDSYYFAKDGQLFNIVILHVGGKEDWNIYDHILNSFQFD